MFVLKKPLPDVESAGALPAPAPATAGAAATAPRRRKLWELEEKHHCPVVGTCLAMGDLVRLARRFDFASDPRDEFALHVEAVNRTLKREPFAETLHKDLEKKYALTVKRFEAATSDLAVRSFWRSSVERGEVAAALWATMTHKHASATTRHLVYADLHMLTHQVGAGKTADIRRLAVLEAAHVEQERLLASERHEAERRHHELLQRCVDKDARLNRLAGIEAEAASLRTRLTAFENGTTLIEMGQRLVSLTAVNEHQRAELLRLQTTEQSLQQCQAALRHALAERDQLAAEHEALERLLLRQTRPDEATNNPDKPCADGSTSLCATACPLPASERGGPRCVLCVGGRTALISHYQALAQRIGIRLVHHDGGREEALSRLPDMIAGADAVICPTDAVSHSAYYQIKHQCRRNGKPCLLYKGAGVSSFALALERLAAGEASLPADT